MEKPPNPPNKYLRHARKLVPEVIKEAVNYVVFPYVGDVVRGFTSYFRNSPKVLDKDGLYENGVLMLKRARRSIVVVNTVGFEDSQNYVLDWGHKYQKEYFEELFRIVQKNRHGIGSSLKIDRYMDLNDIQKCEESISLLLYGRNIVIHDSTIPMEFLIRDDEEVLLGFPDENVLSHGFKLRGQSVAQKLNRWISIQSMSGRRVAEHSPPEGQAATSVPPAAPAGFTEPQQLGRHIREKREQNRKPISDYSLIHALGLLEGMGVENPLDATKKAFDGFIDWYPDLYDQSACEFCYKALATYIKDHIQVDSPTFLDVGCAHGLGAEVLDMQGIIYWGVDASETLLARARQRLPRRSNNFIADDMIKILLARSKNSNGLPSKLDVIACQGNTFDFFLGDLQKWFALTLFKSRLRSNGILFMTQKSFTKGETRVERKLPAPGGIDTIVYDLEWRGDFVRIDVKIDEKHLGSVIQHPTDPQWLEDTCRKAGFKRLTDAQSNLPAWFGPRGGSPYEVYVFQLTD